MLGGGGVVGVVSQPRRNRRGRVATPPNSEGQRDGSVEAAAALLGLGEDGACAHPLGGERAGF